MTLTAKRRRANGLHLLQLWLPREVVAKLDAICEQEEHTRAELIRAYIEQEYEEIAQQQP